MSLSVSFSLQHLEHLEETGTCPVSCKQRKRMMGMLCLLAHSDAKLRTGCTKTKTGTKYKILYFTVNIYIFQT